MKKSKIMGKVITLSTIKGRTSLYFLAAKVLKTKERFKCTVDGQRVVIVRG